MEANKVTITSYMQEELTVKLSRREVYWIRDVSKRRLNAAMQGMSALNAGPAKRSARREEYEFHQNLISRLYGVDPTEDEVMALREAEIARQAIELQERAAPGRRSEGARPPAHWRGIVNIFEKSV